EFGSSVTDADRSRVRTIALEIADFRTALKSGTALRPAGLSSESDAPSSLPLLGEVEKTVCLIHEVFSGAQSPTVYVALDEREQATPLVAGALSNPEHIKFALRGALAASLSYIIFNSLF